MKTNTGLIATSKPNPPKEKIPKEEIQRELRYLTKKVVLMGMDAVEKRLSWKTYQKESYKIYDRIRELKNDLK